jgi:hypothetical protein
VALQVEIRSKLQQKLGLIHLALETGIVQESHSQPLLLILREPTIRVSSEFQQEMHLFNIVVLCSTH